MNLHSPFHLMDSTIKQGMITFIIVISCMGCSFFGENAPIEDGLFLSYDFDGSIIRVTFSETASGKFYAILTSGSTEDSTNPPSPENRKIVDKRLATNLGSPYEAGILGPIWVPSSSIKKGGSAHGDPIQEIRNWEGWEVGVVKASFGRGALRGEWYYEKSTGFLVGGMRGSVLDAPDGGTYFILDDTNLSALLEKQSH